MPVSTSRNQSNRISVSSISRLDAPWKPAARRRRESATRADSSRTPVGVTIAIVRSGIARRTGVHSRGLSRQSPAYRTIGSASITRSRWTKRLRAARMTSPPRGGAQPPEPGDYPCLDELQQAVGSRPQNEIVVRAADLERAPHFLLVAIDP